MVGFVKYLFLGIFFFSPFTEFRLAGLKLSEILTLLTIFIITTKHKSFLRFSPNNKKFAILFILVILISALLSFFDSINTYAYGVDKGVYYSFEYGCFFKILRLWVVLCFTAILERQLIIKTSFVDTVCNSYILANILVDLYGITYFFTTIHSFAEFGNIRTNLFAAEPSEAGFINCFAIILALRHWWQWDKTKVLILCILIMGQLVIGSTTSIVSVILSIAMTYIYYNKNNNGISSKMLIMYISIIVMSTVLFYWLATYTQILDKILNVQDDFNSENAGGSAIERITTIETCWEIFKVRPFLGVGFGNFGWYLKHYVTSPLLLYVPGGAFQPNNTYMQILAELGVVGFAIYAWFILRQFIKLNKLLKHNTKNKSIYFLYSLLIYILIHSLTLPTIYSFQFWIVVAIIQSMSFKYIKK